MKFRTLIFLLSCVSLFSVIIFLYGDSRPKKNDFNFEIKRDKHDRKRAKLNEIYTSTQDVYEVQKYLHYLGIQPSPHLYSKGTEQILPLPVFVTAVSTADIGLIPRYVSSFQFHLPDYILFIYTLNFSPSEVSKVYASCNSSSCSVRLFDFRLYPAHVQDLKLSAYRPIIIQEVLYQSGAVLWLDIQYRFTSHNIKSLMEKAKKQGVVSWSINRPTSSLTHPHMYKYFGTIQENYFFHRMVQPNCIIIFYSFAIREELMMPWVLCALIEDCIAPIGAQSSGCRFDKKPLYRYSGCHRYDMSALNLALGRKFDFSSSRYTAKEEEKFFRHIEFQIREATLSHNNMRNTTTIFSNASK